MAIFISHSSAIPLYFDVVTVTFKCLFGRSVNIPEHDDCNSDFCTGRGQDVSLGFFFFVLLFISSTGVSSSTFLLREESLLCCFLSCLMNIHPPSLPPYHGGCFKLRKSAHFTCRHSHNST